MKVIDICKKYSIPTNKQIVLYDGVCNLCSFFVKVILKHDKKDVFRLAQLNSSFGKEISSLIHSETNSKKQTVILISNFNITTQSTAALLILKELGSIGKILYVFIVIPPFIRNTIYRFVAKYRYFIFGRKKKCMLLEDAKRKKFIL